MAWVKLGGNNGPIQKWNAPGQTFEGIFVGLRNGKTFGTAGPSKLVDLKNEDGTPVTYGAPTVLADRLSGVASGLKVRIEYKGEQIRPGKLPLKMFDVNVDMPDAPGTVAPPIPAAPVVVAPPVVAPPAPVVQPPAQPGHTFETLTTILIAAKGADAGNAIASAIKSMEGDPVERMKKTLTAQGVAF